MKIGGRAWIDGEMVSTTPARLAENYDRVIILAPMPRSYGLILGEVDDAQAMRSKGSFASLITPDAESIKAIGPNIYDPTHVRDVAKAGHEQGQKIAVDMLDKW